MLIDMMAEQWYGYGRWDAPFWFIGIQPGGDDVNSAVTAWDKLGGGELLDCKEHHLAFGYRRWHTPPYCLQPTWRRLILLLLSFQGEDAPLDALRAYQAAMWGAEDGETCVIELSSIASKRFRCPTDDAFLERRIAHIKQRVSQYRPQFVVMYSDDKRILPLWEQVSGCSFGSERIAKTGQTLAMVTPHPTAFHQKDADWIQFGRTLRQHAMPSTIRV